MSHSPTNPDHDPEDPALRPGRNALGAILKTCGIALDDSQLDRLWSYHQLLRAANARLNLTRIHNFENMVLKHYVDSLLVLKFVELPSPLIDMGSGPGLPGIPLKIARPETEMILAEPRGNRAEFLAEVCARLGLEEIKVYPHKLGPDYPGQVQGVISRPSERLQRRSNAWPACLAPGGRMLFMKGPECDSEIADAGRLQARLFKLAADHAYAIPGTTHHRRLLVYERLESRCPAAAAPLATGPSFEGTSARGLQRIESEFQALSRPTWRTRHPQARSSADRRGTDRR